MGEVIKSISVENFVAGERELTMGQMLSAGALGLPGYVTESKRSHDPACSLLVAVEQPPTSCPYCGGALLAGFGRRERFVRDLPRGEAPIGFAVSIRRMRCNECRRTFTEQPPGVDPRRFMTIRLIEWMCHQAEGRALTEIAKEVGVVEGTVRSVCRNVARAAHARSKSQGGL